MRTELTIRQLYHLEHTQAKPLLETLIYPWEALPLIHDFILALGESLPQDEYTKAGDGIWIHQRANVFPSAYIEGPAIIGPDTEVRHGAFIRKNVLVGVGCVVGNSTELKNVILFDKVQVPHYNYVGDSILGYHSHLGAGAITSNVKQIRSNVHVKGDGFDLDSGCEKFGAMLGDFVEVGCNSVLNPGTVVGSHSNIYPLSMVRGYVPADSIYKRKGEIACRNVN